MKREGMTRAVVCVATTPYYQRGQSRLEKAIQHQAAVASESMGCKIDPPKLEMYRLLPVDCPEDVPYAFKAYALKRACEPGADILLWCDACILPVKSLEPLWERIERDGYWMSRSGFSNYEWTADSAYPDLFPGIYALNGSNEAKLRLARHDNKIIEHVAATAFGLNVRHPKGKAFLDEYYRMASETRAFCGPWTNANYQAQPMDIRPLMGERCQPCGPSDVRGHRHDQTAASVIAWRLGFELTSAPDIFSYGKAGDSFDERTILVADGSYT